MIISDACLGLIKSVGDFYPEAKWQRVIVHFYKNVFTVVPRGKMKHVAMMLKAIQASGDLQAAKEKAESVFLKLRGLRLTKAAKMITDSIDEPLTYYSFPSSY